MVISKESVKYSVKNLAHRKTRSFLTIFSIFLGIAMIFIFISFGWGLFDYINDVASGSSSDKLIVQAKGNAAPGLSDSFQLTDDDLEAVGRAAGVKDVTGAYFKVAEVQQNSERVYTFLMAYDPEKPMIMDISNVGVGKGRELTRGDRGKVLLGYNYQIPNKIFSKAYELGELIDVQGQKLKIVGFLEEIGTPQDDAQIYINNDFLDALYPDSDNFYGWIVARVDTENIEKVKENVEKNLRKERGQDKGEEDFFVQSFEEMIETYSSVLNMVIGFIILIGLISVVVSAVNTANTMVTSVLERVKEIGVLKSIGARNSEIFKIFLFESSLLGFVAGVIGVGLGWFVTLVAKAVLDSAGWGFLSPHYSWSLFIGLVLFATITGGISGMLPAIQASRINPVDALRYE